LLNDCCGFEIEDLENGFFYFGFIEFRGAKRIYTDTDRVRITDSVSELDLASVG
jgi:hypothetical protein